MPARLRSEDGRNTVIRPLALFLRARHCGFRRRGLDFPIIPCNLCGSQENLWRQQVKQLLDEIEHARTESSPEHARGAQERACKSHLLGTSRPLKTRVAPLLTVAVLALATMGASSSAQGDQHRALPARTRSIWLPRLQWQRNARAMGAGTLGFYHLVLEPSAARSWYQRTVSVDQIIDQSD